MPCADPSPASSFQFLIKPVEPQPRRPPPIRATLIVPILAVLVNVAAHVSASAQVNIEQQCRGVAGKPKAYQCCVQIVTKNPRIEECEKEVAVFRCTGNKNSKYASPFGCVMPKL
jgi:hypothetical protein